MSSTPFPTTLYRDLLVKLAKVLELTQQAEGTTTAQAKQALLQATNDFKNAISQAKEVASTIPGGELRLDEQDEVIDMLEKLKARKLEKLAQFSGTPIASSLSVVEDNKMEIDSTASTPFNE